MVEPAHTPNSERPSVTPGERYCIFGASGMLGRALVHNLLRSGALVTAFSRTRKEGRPGIGYWNPATGEIEADRLEGAHVVVNLAGANIAESRWTEARKKLLRSSRVDSTTLLSQTLAKLERRPRVLINASAVGFYGDRGDYAVYEDSRAGTGFLPSLCEAWEGATAPAAEAGVRVLHYRFGVILSPDGGILARMLPAFRLGVGGQIGHGRQRLPWIAMADAIGAIRYGVRRLDLEGPVNIVAPESVTNAQFCEALGRVLHRPAAMRVPGFVLKAALGGELAQEALLTGANVRPRKLEISGYRFEYPRLDDALEALLRRS